MIQLSQLQYVTTGKTIALTVWNIVSKVMSLLSGTLSMFVMAFLPRSKCLLISWLWLLSTVFLEPKLQNKICHHFHFFPNYLPYMLRPDAMILVLSFKLSFKPLFSLSCFTFIKRLFSSSSFSAIRVVSSAYMRLLIFLPAIWFQLVIHPAWHFSWCTLHRSEISRVTIYSLNALNSQIWTRPLFHVLFYFFGPAYRFLRRHVRWSDISIFFRIFQFVLIYTVKWQPTPVLLPGKSPGRRSLVGCSPWGCEESDTTERLHFHFSLSRIGEGNGNPLQCSCLENPRD